jgi:hypothetical protein
MMAPSGSEKASGLATRKFEFEDIVNADPLCPPSALKLVRCYLNFLSDFDTPVYLSILDLMVNTSLSNSTVIDLRRKLVGLKYLIPSGKSSDGVLMFKLSLAANENRVLDHIATRREKLRQIEAKRKVKQRAERHTHHVNEQMPRTKAHSVSEVISRTHRPVSGDFSGTDDLVPSEKFTDMSEESSRNYVEKPVEVVSFEGEKLAPACEREKSPGPPEDPMVSALRRSAAFNQALR